MYNSNVETSLENYIDRLGPYCVWLGEVYNKTPLKEEVNSLMRINNMKLGEKRSKNLVQLNSRIDALRVDKITWRIKITKNGEGILGK